VALRSGRRLWSATKRACRSITSADASTHERSLFDRWTTALQTAGVPEGDLATAWDDYRVAALFCLVYPVVAWRGMDVGDPRQRDLAVTMLERFDRAVDELELADLL